MEENESGFDRSLKPDTCRIEAYWERSNLFDHVLSKFVWDFGFSGNRKIRNDPDSYLCRLEVRVENRQFDILVPYSSAVHEPS